MGYGLGAILGGFSEGIDDQRRRKREDFQMEQAEKQAERADTTFQQQQEDRAFGLPYQRKATQRQDELADLEAELKRNEYAIAKLVNGAKTRATQLQAAQQVAELENKNYALVYQAYKTRGGKAAAALLNQMHANGINNAADFVEEQDEKTGRKLIKVVDANGNVVKDEKLGELVLDAEQAEKLYGPKPEKGRFGESERGVIDTATGNFKPHGPGVPGAGGDAKVDPREKELRQLVFPQWGSQLGDKFVFDGKSGEYANQHLRLAIELMDKAGEKGTRNLARYAEEAGRVIRAQKAREEFRGKLSGGWSFNPVEIAKRLEPVFPREIAKPDEVRKFMSEKGITDRRKQDQVLQHLGMPTEATTSAPAERKSQLPAGVTKEQALTQAKTAAARATPHQKALIRERLIGWGITEAELKAAGL